MVLVDTPIWSLALRRRAVDLSPVERRLTQALYQLIGQRNVQLLGATRQEVLSGIRDASQFRRIRDHLRGFSNVELDSADYEEAAHISNQCRQLGIADSSVDMLLCAVSLHHGWEIFTTDRDFIQYGRVVPLQMFSTSWRGSGP
jgi:predicted nucleic acid-binding protein